MTPTTPATDKLAKLANAVVFWKAQLKTAQDEASAATMRAYSAKASLRLAEENLQDALDRSGKPPPRYIIITEDPKP